MIAALRRSFTIPDDCASASPRQAGLAARRALLYMLA